MFLINLNKEYNDLKNIINNNKIKMLKTINKSLLDSYWHVGKTVYFLLNGKRAEYGKHIIEELSKRLTNDFGKGFTKRNIHYMLKFYENFPIVQTVSAQLTWSHYVYILTIKNEDERKFYIRECINNNWSVRDLRRFIKTNVFNRRVKFDNNKKLISKDYTEIIKDPYIFEFLNLKSNYKEKDLEDELINNLERFLLELGLYYSFVARQQRITINKINYYIDLVLFNTKLNCYVLIDLKIGKVKTKDIGQMNLYVNYYKNKYPTNKQPLGLIICKEKDDKILTITLADNSNIYASIYKDYLPSKL